MPFINPCIKFCPHPSACEIRLFQPFEIVFHILLSTPETAETPALKAPVTSDHKDRTIPETVRHMFVQPDTSKSQNGFIIPHKKLIAALNAFFTSFHKLVTIDFVVFQITVQPRTSSSQNVVTQDFTRFRAPVITPTVSFQRIVAPAFNRFHSCTAASTVALK